uniref:MFS domain-containing protein n=1 Tax=Rhabditophanes sp. KR3021 TaxID=114890 RepID=A0AC35U4F7_9BILA
MEGVCEGVTYPAMHVIWSKWAPYTEKTRLGSFAFSGSYFGTVVSVSLSAYIGEYFGWPAIFFFFGVVALLWCAAWIKFVRENPEDDPHISGDELALIKTSIIPLTNELLNWKDCMTSGPVWAIITAHFCENWGFYTMLTYLPNILKDITHFELETVGTVSAIPYWVMGFTLIFAGVYSDRLIERHNWSVERVRRTFCCFGFVGQAAALIAASFTSSSTPLIIALILSIGLGGFPWSSFSVNHLDIAPQYAGQLMGISNTIATIPGMISPLIVGSVITSGTFVEWSTVFYLTSVIYLFGAAVFFKYVSGDIVPWAKEPNLLTASFSVTD